MPTTAHHSAATVRAYGTWCASQASCPVCQALGKDGAQTDPPPTQAPASSLKSSRACGAGYTQRTHQASLAAWHGDVVVRRLQQKKHRELHVQAHLDDLLRPRVILAEYAAASCATRAVTTRSRSDQRRSAHRPCRSAPAPPARLAPAARPQPAETGPASAAGAPGR